MRWREKGRLGNAEWLRCLGVLSCIVGIVLDGGGGWEEASEAGEAENAASTDDEKNRVRAQRWAWRGEMIQAGRGLFSGQPPRRTRR